MTKFFIDSLIIILGNLTQPARRQCSVLQVCIPLLLLMLLLLYVTVLSVHHCVPSVLGSQKTASDPQ